MTQFQQSMLAAEEGQQQVPTVVFEGQTIPFHGYQLATHIYALRIMAIGMKMRGITFTQIKKYYGLSGKSAKDCLPQLQAIQEKYRELAQNN
jgi:hypothetical protein